MSLRPILIDVLLEPTGIVGEQAIDADFGKVGRKAFSPMVIDGVDQNRNMMLL